MIIDECVDRTRSLAMLILALDTSTPTGSIAIARDRDLVAEFAGDPSLTHGERLPADIDRVVREAGLSLAAIDLYAVAAGPGPLTGLRVGIATIQGLAMAHGRQVVPLSALEALVWATVMGQVVARPRELLGACLDAHRGEVFAGLYQLAEPALAQVEDAERRARMPVRPVVEVLDPPAVAAPGDLVERWATLAAGRPVRLVGEGAWRYRAVLADIPRGQVVDVVPPLAAALTAMASTRVRDAVAPSAVRPLYLRRPDAVVARARAREEG